MAQDPDPNVELTTARGVTRTLDDWTTSFHLALTVLPGRPEAASFVRIGKRIADVLGGSNQTLTGKCAQHATKAALGVQVEARKRPVGAVLAGAERH